ncbi:DUF349 domain-containing protein [Sungkyunkwania multivorans]|uniref:DUF349 domain-containing protein n=1 Tax=Sungkyunkwania multivorans TaxID=1173618 RepID=A0ABW3CVW1_9FLAO
MLEEKNDNLPLADGSEEVPVDESKADKASEDTTETPAKELSETASDQSVKATTPSDEVEDAEEKEPVTTGEKTKEEHEDALNEIDDSVAEDAEDEEKSRRHEIPMLDYHSMTMEALVDEFAKLVRNEKIQAIKQHVDGIRNEFNQKYSELIEQKKEEFLSEGGQDIDFRYNAPVKSRFNAVYSEYKEKRNAHYQQLEKDLKTNLQRRIEIIEELKGLINVEENINTTYKHFKELQEAWRNAGPIPKMQYNNIWRTYHHHVERFYDFLHLNRDLRDLDFKHNLEEKMKIITRAEELTQLDDVGLAFRELQNLHKLWKEEVGPVAKEHREEIWNRFSAATKAIHDKRQDYYKDLEKTFEDNLIKKQEIIGKIIEVGSEKVNSHSAWQKKIKEIEALRESFFNAGRVPQKKNEETWSAFKEAVRSFNRNKNDFYKGLKKEQQNNLNKKMELVKLAESLKDSEDWESTTPIMKKIQSDWKSIGHVPRKYSDKIWNEFKSACNHYFDRFHATRNEANKEENEAFEKKKEFLDNLKSFELTGDRDTDLAAIKQKIAEWKAIGRVPFNKRNVEGKFNKVLDALFGKLNMSKKEAELMKYGNRLDGLEGDDIGIQKERTFILRKIDEIKSEINQLENNLQFFKHADDSNPIVKDVHKNIKRHKDALDVWKAKLKRLKSL